LKNAVDHAADVTQESAMKTLCQFLFSQKRSEKREAEQGFRFRQSDPRAKRNDVN
jgi:hypothetical protein